MLNDLRKHALVRGNGIAAWLVLAICFSSVGCQSQWSNPFAGPQPTYKTTYGLTPQQRIAQLGQLAAQLPQRSGDEQINTTQKLTEELSTETDPLIRRALVRTIGVLTDGYSDPTLLAASNDSDPLVREAACEAWGRRQTTTAVNALSKLLVEDDSVDVRLAAVKALANVPSPQSVQLLGSSLDDKNPALQLAAIEALEQATDRRLGQDINAWHKYLATLTTAPTVANATVPLATATTYPVQQASAISPMSPADPITTSHAAASSGGEFAPAASR